MSGKRRKGYDRSVYQSLALVMQFGINMLVPICLMCAFGIFLDDRLGTSFLVILFFFMGAAAGGQNIYRMSKKIYGSADKERTVREETVNREKQKE